MTWVDIISLVGIPVVRSVAGWLENAFQNGVIDAFEWAKLGETIVRVGIIGFVAYFGLNALGVDVSGLATGAGAFVFDFLLMAIKKKKK